MGDHLSITRKPGWPCTHDPPALGAVRATVSPVAEGPGSRNPVAQMPPLGTQVVDEEALSVVRHWIEQDVHGRPGDAQARSISRHQRRSTR